MQMVTGSHARLVAVARFVKPTGSAGTSPLKRAKRRCTGLQPVYWLPLTEPTGFNPRRASLATLPGYFVNLHNSAAGMPNPINRVDARAGSQSVLMGFGISSEGFTDAGSIGPRHR